MPDYSKGQIYIIRNHVDDRVYIGSTIMTLARRMSNHRFEARRNKPFKIYQAFNNLGVENFYIEKLEEFPCSDLQALVSREGHYIRLYDSVNNGLNGKIAGRTENEWTRERYASDPEYREKRRESSRNFREKQANDADFREKCRDKNEKYMAHKRATDAEFREKERERLRKYAATCRANKKLK